MNVQMIDSMYDNDYPNLWEGKDIGSMLSCEPSYIPATSRYTCRACPVKIRGEACIYTNESGSVHYHPDCYYELIRALQRKLEVLIPRLNEEVLKQHEED